MQTALLTRTIINRCAAMAILCLAYCTAQGQQPYTPLVQENATWILWYSPDDFIDHYYSAYRLEGDTVVDGKAYKKLYVYALQMNQYDPYTVVAKQFVGVMREDVPARRVYARVFTPSWFSYSSERCMYEFAQPDEHLLIDFNLTEGDTLKDCHLDYSDYLEGHSVIMTDTMLDRYGQERRVLVDEEYVELIEGVGYDDGLFMQAHGWIHAGWGFGLADFCIGALSDCNLTTSTTDLSEESRVFVFPNPASREIHVISTKRIREIQLFDPLGRHVQTTAESVLFLRPALPSGVYSIRVAFRAGGVRVHKVVVLTD